MSKTAKQNAMTAAKLGSQMAASRVTGMKVRAQINQPRAAVGHMPFAEHRTCAEWEERGGKIVTKEMSPRERRRDAERGSAMLRDAILRCLGYPHNPQKPMFRGELTEERIAA